MAAESERPPYPNGTSGQSRSAKHADSNTAHRPTSEAEVADMLQSTVKSSNPAMSQVPKLLPNSPTVSAPASISNSVASSRESSPVRITSRTTNNPSPTRRAPSQSRKGSQDRISPIRSSLNGQASALPVPASSSSGQRVSANPSNPPSLPPPPAPDPPANVPSPEKPAMPSLAETRRTDQDSTLPNTSLKRTSPSSEESGKADRSTPRAVSGRVNGQGSSLETVQEMASDGSTPSGDTAVKPATPEDSRLHTIDENPTPRASKQTTESGSDSGGNCSLKEDGRSNATGNDKASGAVMPQRSTTSLSAGARGKPADGSVRNMIVETETVSSIPQVSLGVGSGERGSAGRGEQGTLRMKPSTETIRPRKEKKKNRRANALPTGPASSKADIFEAKVANAVDEADVSDSDETFVYESNPPDPYPPRQSRYHSRTPSATSMASQIDQLPGRGRGMRDVSHGVTGKRSMKFKTNQYNNALDGEAGDVDGNSNATRGDGSGTVTPRHHHVGRHGRNGAYPSLFDSDSPFPQTQSQVKSPRHFIGGGYRHSRNGHARPSANYGSVKSAKKAGDMIGYDFDAEGADDERTPLMNAPRTPRSRHGRRPNSASLRQMEYMARQRGMLSRYGSCAVILLLLFLIAGGATSFVFAATKTLVDVEVVAIQNVLASEQEIMLDLNVEAVNPNIFPVTIDDTDVNIFAKSRYVGTDKFWREHGSQELDQFPRVKQSRRRWELSQLVRCSGDKDCKRAASAGKSKHSNGGIDKGTDPISDPEGDSQTMLLGRVFRFDSPLSFDASPWTNMASTSTGQIRLPRPGNKTEEGGTERWERVLQHPFELIVRGVVKYQLPLSSRFHSASISSSVKVVPDADPEDPNDPDNPPSNETAHITFSHRSTPNLRIDAPSKHRVTKRQFTA